MKDGTAAVGLERITAALLNQCQRGDGLAMLSREIARTGCTPAPKPTSSKAAGSLNKLSLRLGCCWHCDGFLGRGPCARCIYIYIYIYIWSRGQNYRLLHLL